MNCFTKLNNSILNDVFPYGCSFKTKRYFCMAGLSLMVSLFGAGCASTSVFKSYPDKVNSVIGKLKNGQELDPSLFKKEVDSKDKTLYLMERGRVKQLLGDTELSQKDYGLAVDAIKEDDEKAKISASDAVGQAASIILNDNAIPYDAAGYERVLLRYLQALNYLSSGDLDGARVEIANADAEQKEAEERYVKEIEKAEAKAAEEREKKANSSPVQPNEAVSGSFNNNDAPAGEKPAAKAKSPFGGLGGALASMKKTPEASLPISNGNQQSNQASFSQIYDLVKSSLGEQYAGLDEMVGQVKNSFQNGAAFYLSGLIYEALGNYNNAYISYKKALELAPGNRTLQTDVARIALIDSRPDDLADFKTRFGLGDETVKATIPAEGHGAVVVLYEGGYVIQKKEVKIPIPLFGVENSPQGGKNVNLRGASFIAFPIYDTKVDPLPGLSVKAGDLTTETMSLCSVNSLAVKNLKERIPVMLTRQVIRFTLKSAAVKAAHDNGGALAGLAASAAVGATEKADLRSWLTLPQEFHVCRLVLPAGEQDLTISSGNGTEHEAKVQVESGKTSIIRVADAAAGLSVKSSLF